MDSQSKKKIIYITSSPLTIKHFLRYQIIRLSNLYDVSIICKIDKNSPPINFDLPSEIKIYNAPIYRKINFYFDIKALIKIYLLFLNLKPEIIHSFTPKAGLLTNFAGFLARVPHRIHTFTGQVWVTKKGFFKILLKFFDKLIVYFSNQILIDSPSQKDFLIEQNILNFKKNNFNVLGKGSISGVDINRFKKLTNLIEQFKSQLKINSKSFLLLYLGRLNRDKGIFDLIEAFIKVRKKNLNVELLIVGPDEEKIHDELISKLNIFSKNVYLFSHTNYPEKFYSITDLFVMPSYREGFGNVILEAAACGVPSIASNIYGLSDALVDGETGLLFEKKNIDDLVNKIEFLYKNNDKLNIFGKNAKVRASKYFSQDKVINELIMFYSRLNNSYLNL